MKVRVAFTIDVDPATWSAEYGIEPAEVRRDVQDHAEQSIRAHFDSVGVLNH